MKRIEIIGGGLAGLVLANQLVEQRIPTVLHEAGSYPRHRVCGEFLCGKGAQLLQNSALKEILKDSIEQRSTVWFNPNGKMFERCIPQNAIGLSRFAMDQRLAERFVALGGELITRSRIQANHNVEGRVYCTGRTPATSNWIGLKVHLENFDGIHDLELHFGENCYVGISKIENEKWNLCALFKRRPECNGKKDDLILNYIQACGLDYLHKRISRSSLLAESHASVAGIEFKLSRSKEAKISLGDRYGVIPPFTGNGMSIAIESAFVASNPLAAYAKGRFSWSQTECQVNAQLDNALRRRFRTAELIHPFLFKPVFRKILSLGIKHQIIPFNFMFKQTH